MRFVGRLVGVDFQDADLREAAFDGDRVQRKHPGFETDGCLDLFRQQCPVGIEPGRIDIQFRDANKRLRAGFDHDTCSKDRENGRDDGHAPRQAGEPLRRQTPASSKTFLTIGSAVMAGGQPA